MESEIFFFSETTNNLKYKLYVNTPLQSRISVLNKHHFSLIRFNTHTHENIIRRLGKRGA